MISSTQRTDAMNVSM